MPDSRSSARAVLLAGALALSDIDPTSSAQRRGPAVVRKVSGVDTPLDLEVDVFRYLVRADRSVVVLKNSIVRFCRVAHRRLRSRSFSRRPGRNAGQ